MSMNDDRSPLLDLMNCIVRDQAMKLEKIDPDDQGGANRVAVLSDCLCFAEAAFRARYFVMAG